MPTIAIENLTKRFGKQESPALDCISLTFEENRIYGLLGRNGAGKSTLLNIISNRLFPNSGKVLLDGRPTMEQDALLSQIYCMSEKDLCPESMRIRELFRYTSDFFPGFDIEYANGLAKKFQLDTNKRLKSLSTGYSTICKIVTAMASFAPVTLLDEPILGLDANHRELFYKELIASYLESPRTIILSTHLIEEVADLIEEVVILHNGRILLNESREQALMRGYSLSGTARAVDSYLSALPSGETLLGCDSLGGLKTACILTQQPGSIPDNLPDGLEAGRLDLQQLFIRLTNQADGGQLRS